MASRRIKADNRTPRPPIGGGKKPPTKKGAVEQAKGINVGFGKMPMPPAGSGSMTTLPAKVGIRKPPTKGGKTWATGKQGAYKPSAIGKMPRVPSGPKRKRTGATKYGRGML